MFIEEFKSKYLIFNKYKEDNKKTFNVLIYSRNNLDYQIAKIYYKPQWRTYVFESGQDIIYDSKCLTEILEYVDKLNNNRRENLKLFNCIK